jgi:twinfilin-like protein
MAATSGIGVSPELTETFSDAIETKNVRFIKIIIQDGLCLFTCLHH